MSKSFREDLTGQRFGRLTVIEFVPNNKPNSYWKCRCDCGSMVTVQGIALKQRMTKSCGCLQKEQTILSHTVHGGKGTKLYFVWRAMRQRCNSSKSKAYKDYGERGIRVCSDWQNSFSGFREWAIANGYKEGLSIDRIDVNGNYEPSNCRWVDMKTQLRNLRNNVIVEYKGKKMTLSEVAEKTNIELATLRTRYYKGDRGERLFRPVEK